MAIIAIVEGHGEVESVPILVRRISSELDGNKIRLLNKNDVIRIPRSKLLRPGEIEKAVLALCRGQNKFLLSWARVFQGMQTAKSSAKRSRVPSPKVLIAS